MENQKKNTGPMTRPMRKRREQRRERGEKSHEIKQSVPRARWRSDCVAE